MYAKLLDVLVYVLLAIPQIILFPGTNAPEVVKVLHQHMGGCMREVLWHRCQVKQEALTLLGCIHQLN